MQCQQPGPDGLACEAGAGPTPSEPCPPCSEMQGHQVLLRQLQGRWESALLLRPRRAGELLPRCPSRAPWPSSDSHGSGRGMCAGLVRGFLGTAVLFRTDADGPQSPHCGTEAWLQGWECDRRVQQEQEDRGSPCGSPAAAQPLLTCGAGQSWCRASQWCCPHIWPENAR